MNKRKINDFKDKFPSSLEDEPRKELIEFKTPKNKSIFYTNKKYYYNLSNRKINITAIIKKYRPTLIKWIEEKIK